jgi:hypothetical protein
VLQTEYDNKKGTVCEISSSHGCEYEVQICLLMEAARTSETSVDNYFTRQYIPEDKSEQGTVCSPAKRLSKLGKSMGSVGRRWCFIVHRKNIKLMGINVCFQLLSQHKHEDNEGVKITQTPILQICQNWHSHLTNKNNVRQVFFSEWIVASNVVPYFIYSFLWHTRWRHPPRRIPAMVFQLVNQQYVNKK